MLFSEITWGEEKEGELFFHIQALDIVCVRKLLHHLCETFTRCKKGWKRFFQKFSDTMAVTPRNIFLTLTQGCGTKIKRMRFFELLCTI